MRPPTVSSSRLLLLAAVLLAPGLAAADGWEADEGRLVVQPHLAVGGLLTDAGAGGAAELGLRVGPVRAVSVFRLVDREARGEVAFAGGRVDWLLLEAGWLTVHAGAGGGGLRQRWPGGSSTVPALLGGVGLTLGDRSLFNYGGLGVELLAPLAQARLAAPERPRAPVVMVTLTINPLLLLALKG